MNCSSCLHYGLYQMITSGKAYSYSGDIPCITCCHYNWQRDNYRPMYRDTHTTPEHKDWMDGKEKK